MAVSVSAEDKSTSDASDQDRTGGFALTMYLVAGIFAATIAALIAGVSLSDALVATGLPDPGELTTYGLPVVRAAGEIAAVIAVGSFLLAAFLVPPQRSGVLDVDGYRALRTGTVASAVWGGCALLMVPLTLSDVSGQPLRTAIRIGNLWELADQIETASAWRWTALIALLLTVISVPIIRWSWTPMLLLLSVVSLLPLALSGHSSSGGSHDMATNSLIVHLIAAALWAGGLFALVAHVHRRDAQNNNIAARRFSSIALVCFVVLATSGVINAIVRIAPSDVLTTHYGRLVLAKIIALIVLGGFGVLQRRRALSALMAEPSNRRPLLKIASVEALVLAGTVGLAIGLGRTPPPPPPNTYPSIPEVELGYNLAGPPTFERLALDWRFDLIFGTSAIVMAVLYLLGVRKLYVRGDVWSPGRTVAWLLGCAVLLVATSSGIGKYAPAVFSVHMGAHMLLSMLVPVLLALGGAVTLALRALTPAGKNGVPGAREWILFALHSPFSRAVTHPLVASVLFVGGFYALYLGGIFAAAVDSHFGHVLMNIHFLLSGYIFYWVVIGVDPAPRNLPPVGKLGMVFASLPFHAFFGITLMSMDTVLGETFYRSLGLHWHTDLLGDQRLGGGIAWSTGEMPLVLVILALLVQWSKTDRRTAKRVDRAADNDHDADLAAHNAMFAELARRDRETEG
ncbi:MAG: cytochrome c oxidase assembly protein [Mycobacteriaceae bacterium]